MRTFDLTYISGEVFNNDVFVREDNYVRVFRKDPSVDEVFVNGRPYRFYTDNIEIELSDYIAALGNGNLDIDCNTDHASFAYTVYDGISPKTNVLVPPPRIPISPDNLYSFETYYSDAFSSDATMIFKENGTTLISNLTTYQGKIKQTSIGLTPTTTYITAEVIIVNGVDNLPEEAGMPNFMNVGGKYVYRIDLVPLDCDTEYLEMRWRGRHGILKRWTFEVVSRGVKTNGVAEYQSINNSIRRKVNGYGREITLVARDVDILAQNYISDIVSSDYIILGNDFDGNPIYAECEDTECTIDDVRKDFEFKLKIKEYR